MISNWHFEREILGTLSVESLLLITSPASSPWRRCRTWGHYGPASAVTYGVAVSDALVCRVTRHVAGAAGHHPHHPSRVRRAVGTTVTVATHILPCCAGMRCRLTGYSRRSCRIGVVPAGIPRHATSSGVDDLGIVDRVVPSHIGDLFISCFWTRSATPDTIRERAAADCVSRSQYTQWSHS